MTAWYNEFDKEKAAWLRELIKAGLIAPGDVDERSIKDVDAAELMGYAQCHFFAGIGIWSYALRLAGWPDNRPVWTGSCPCPSFSAAGKGAGFDDPRHLWPDWARLIRERKPPVVFGEQVDDAIGFGWLDLVQAELEAEAYAVGKAVLGAASVGAPHIRQRLYLVAQGDAKCGGSQRESIRRSASVFKTLDGSTGPRRSISTPSTGPGKLAESESGRLGTGLRNREQAGEWGILVADGCNDGFVGEPTSGGLAMRRGAPGSSGRVALAGGTDSMEHSFQSRLEGQSRDGDDSDEPRRIGAGEAGSVAEAGEPCVMGQPESLRCNENVAGDGCGQEGPGRSLWEKPDRSSAMGRPGPVNGFWRDADWIRCRDALWRPVRPGTLPLVAGAPARVVRLRGYGDGITAQTAQAFIESSMEILDENRFPSGPLPHSNERISYKGGCAP